MFPLTLASAKFNLGIAEEDSSHDVLIKGYILAAKAQIEQAIGPKWANTPPTKSASNLIFQSAQLLVSTFYEAKTTSIIEFSPTKEVVPLALALLRPLQSERLTDPALWGEPNISVEADMDYQQLKNTLKSSPTIEVEADDTTEEIQFRAIGQTAFARRAGWVSALPVQEGNVLGSTASSTDNTITLPAVAADSYLWFWLSGDKALHSILVAGYGNLLTEFSRSSLTVNNIDGTLYTSRDKLGQALGGQDTIIN